MLRNLNTNETNINYFLFTKAVKSDDLEKNLSFENEDAWKYLSWGSHNEVKCQDRQRVTPSSHFLQPVSSDFEACSQFLPPDESLS